MEDEKYTVTVYIAAPGTPLVKEDPGASSLPGHMFYTTSNGHVTQSYGFAPIKHGNIDGPGAIARDDVQNYKDPLYSRTMEVSKQQYDKLNDFGQHPDKHGFNTYYKDARHNCVDFAWSALNHADLKRSYLLGGKGVDVDGPGALRPAHNVEAEGQQIQNNHQLDQQQQTQAVQPHSPVMKIG
ncbi:hypothetical protein SAMN05216570_2583 [Dyella sp. OK004]|uniref:hypothetical protein n=1 Tax=Dyella sp. OK004 TaxID=1855292 RepID=UPI0008EB341B|nr:hypothetical protein [Dyella sp. OK004]SFS11904.1 hypothetical protein SAMN05216570_2583 [Dyella sp. OK004]